MRILLVEDDPTTSKSIELMLTHANLNVYATDLGEEGIDLAKLYDYDLILLDINLPDMTGHEVQSHLVPIAHGESKKKKKNGCLEQQPEKRFHAPLQTVPSYCACTGQHSRQL